MALPEVLIVDDDQLIRAMVRDALSDVPCEIREADSGDAALAVIAERNPAVVLLDLVMPGKSGLDVLKSLEPTHSDTWRRLDVAILQRYLLDEVITPHFAPGAEVTRGYTADPDEIAPQVDGQRYQIALLLQSTPLHSLEHLGKSNEVMPQKSTFFYPKVATGLVMNTLT